MVLVRKSELACRDGWDHDLWEPREPGQNGTQNRPSSRNISSAHARVQNGTSTPERSRLGNSRAEREPASRTEPARRNGAHSSTETDRSETHRHTQERGGFPDGVDELQDETIAIHSVTSRKPRPEPFRDQPVKPDVRSSDGGAAVLERHSPVKVVWPERPQQAANEYQSEQREDVDPQPPVRQSGATEQFEVAPVEPESFGVQDVQEFVEDDDEVDVALESGNVTDDRDSIKLPMLETSNACCRNCRDFIPAKNGQGGFCDNPYAFEQRQHVSGETVACQSSFGSWWSPSDDWWMERADIAHHSAPTPLVNNLIRQIRSRYLEEEGSTEGQERS